jgi:hypothetical protein
MSLPFPMGIIITGGGAALTALMAFQLYTALHLRLIDRKLSKLERAHDWLQAHRNAEIANETGLAKELRSILELAQAERDLVLEEMERLKMVAPPRDGTERYPLVPEAAAVRPAAEDPEDTEEITPPTPSRARR